MGHERVLVVDDEVEIVRVLQAYLVQAGYTVFTAFDGLTALSVLRQERPSVVILDLMLPDRDGLDITRFIRGEASLARTHILMLTARVDDKDKVVGLEVGADDYVTKPFNPREIVARVRAVFRRTQIDETHASEQILRYEKLFVDVARHVVSLDDEVIDLTPTEFNLLLTLMRRPGVPFSRADLVQRKLGYDVESLERTLDSHVRNLRRKIEPDSNNPLYIQTVYGVGYRLGYP